MRPVGRPPPNTESSPAMPVGTFGSPFLLRAPAATLPRAPRVDVDTAVPPYIPGQTSEIGATLRNAAGASSRRNPIAGEKQAIVLDSGQSGFGEHPVPT
jgi:hypothetical protein